MSGALPYVVVSTAETSFAIPSGNMAPEKKHWSSGAFMCDSIPTLPEYGDSSFMGGDIEPALDAVRVKVLADFDGNMNTAKITAVDNVANSAAWCVSRSSNSTCDFLPSAGQLMLMLQNAAAINAMMTAMKELDLWLSDDFNLLPYRDENGVLQFPDEAEFWVSSTACYKYFAFGVYEDGLSIAPRNLPVGVRAVTAIHWEDEQIYP